MNKLTGYPFIDKPWMKFYNEEQLDFNFPKMNIYDYLCNSIEGKENYIAITYFGREISYSEMKDHIEEAFDMLCEMGVKAKDRVLFLMPNIPETAYLFYAVAKLGAVADFIDPRPDSIDPSISATKVMSLIESERINHIVSLDLCYIAMINPIEKQLWEYGIKDLLIVSAQDSMNKKAKSEYLKENLYISGIQGVKKNLAKQKMQGKLIEERIENSLLKINQYGFWKEKYRGAECKKSAYYEEDLLVAIVHTSGTSSARPKPIPLTHDNLNAYVHQTKVANMPMHEKDRTLQMLPYFAAYGLVDVVHAGFCHINNMIQIPEFSPKDFGKYIAYYRPQTIIGAPSWFAAMIKDKKLRNADLSCLTMVTYGGDSMEHHVEEQINDFLKKHKCKTVLTKGHGMSETCGCSSYATGTYNELGSVGIPMPYTTYALVHPETKEMLKFEDAQEYIEGELVISSPMVTKGILDDEVIVPHIKYDGEDYILTRDIARMDRDGKMTFLARSDRSFTRYDGFKIKPYEIENVIKQFASIKQCIIVPYQDKDKDGIMPLAIITLKDNYISERKEQVHFVQQLIDECFIKNKDVSSRQIPSRIAFKEEMPYTPNGKVDYKRLTEEGLCGKEIKIEMEENSIEISKIVVR